ncbi:MAG TPA: hypothetical protein VGI40_16225 [Pirellulaceae bacterium]|jgi:hypothetical protein
MTQRMKPAHEFRFGRIKTTIWANQAAGGDVWFSVEIVRLYCEGEKWHESTSFGRDDLPLVAKASELAFAWIWSQSGSYGSQRSDSTPPPKSR